MMMLMMVLMTSIMMTLNRNSLFKMWCLPINLKYKSVLVPNPCFRFKSFAAYNLVTPATRFWHRAFPDLTFWLLSHRGWHLTAPICRVTSTLSSSRGAIWQSGTSDERYLRWEVPQMRGTWDERYLRWKVPEMRGTWAERYLSWEVLRWGVPELRGTWAERYLRWEVPCLSGVFISVAFLLEQLSSPTWVEKWLNHAVDGVDSVW